MKIGVIHGPNLGLLGRREPERYGTTSLEEVDTSLEDLAAELSVELEIFRSNHEGEILDWIEASSDRVLGYVINPGALTHTSIGLRDAFLAVGRPFAEVHLSNVHARESFRRHSYLSDVAGGVVFGFGPVGYLLGLRGLVSRLREPTGPDASSAGDSTS